MSSKQPRSAIIIENHHTLGHKFRFFHRVLVFKAKLFHKFCFSTNFSSLGQKFVG